MVSSCVCVCVSAWNRKSFDVKLKYKMTNNLTFTGVFKTIKFDTHRQRNMDMGSLAIASIKMWTTVGYSLTLYDEKNKINYQHHCCVRVDIF